MDEMITKIDSIAESFTEAAKTSPYEAARMYVEAFAAVDFSRDTEVQKADAGSVTPPMNELYKGIKG